LAISTIQNLTVPFLGATQTLIHTSFRSLRNWNDQKGFGFISPSEGGEDVFVHRSGLGEGMDALSPGMSVSFMPQWDEKKRKDRASDVRLGVTGRLGKV